MRSRLSEPSLSPDSLLHVLPKLPRHQREAAAEKLAKQSREELAKVYRDHLWQGHRKNAWLIAEEFTRRGIPPSFRPAPALGDELRLPEEDIFLHDLWWLTIRYPAHRSLLKKYPKPFHPLIFNQVAKNLTWHGLRMPHFYIAKLALTEEQQVECVYLRGAAVRRRMEEIGRLSAEVYDRLKIKNRSNLRARAQTGADWERTIQRRHDVWRAGSMADWQPKRTADLYEMLTGEKMNRSLAGKIIGEVHRDFPDSKPPVRRKRRRKAPKPVRMPMRGRITKVRRGRTKTR